MPRRHSLAQRRRAVGFSQEQIAAHLAVDRSTVARWECGETIPQPHLRPKLAAALQVSTDELAALLEPTPGPPGIAFPLGQPHPAAPLLHPVAGDAPGGSTTPQHGAFERQLRHAWQLRRRDGAAPPCLVLVGGFAGSGKTEFARFLTNITGWCHLDKDVLTRPLTERLLDLLGADPNDRHTNTYLEGVRPLEYRALINAAFGNLGCGVSTVVSAPFLRELPDRGWLRRVAVRCAGRGADLALIWVDADVDSMRAYLYRRDAARDSWKLGHWTEYLASIDLATRPAQPYFLVDNRRNAAVGLADQARRMLDARADG